MAAEYTVTRAKNAGEKPNPHGGTLVKWYVGLKNETEDFDDVYWQRKQGSEVNVGDTVYGTVSQGDYGPRFKIEKRDEGGFSGGGGGRGRSPQDTKAIQRQHSQEMAIRALTLYYGPGAGVSTPDRAAKDWRGEIKDWIDWFEADIQGGSQASPAPSQSPSNGQPEQASTAQKRALTTALNRLGIDNPWQAKIVHAVAGDPPTRLGLSSLLDVVNAPDISEREKLKTLEKRSGVTLAGGDAPADTSGLSGEDIPF